MSMEENTRAFMVKRINSRVIPGVKNLGSAIELSTRLYQLSNLVLQIIPKLSGLQ